MKNKFKITLLFIVLMNTATAQVLRPFTSRYSNPSVKGNIVYVSNSIISTAGVSAAGTAEVPPGGSSNDNGGGGINIDIDNPPNTVLFPLGSSWKWFSTGAEPDPAWEFPAYVDAAWSVGNGDFGYGEVIPAVTCVPSGQVPICLPVGNKWITYYFRNTVNIPSLAGITNFTFNYKRDDGIVVYVNGTEVFRDNMPTGLVDNTTLATAAISGAAETAVNTFVLSGTGPFIAGNNVIAVEMHQNAASSTDLTFDLGLEYGMANATFNSSSSDLVIATTCNQVLWAGLYWGTDQGTDGTNVSWITPDFNTVKLKTPGSPVYQNITASQSDIHNAAIFSGLAHTGYTCFADITSLININNANGTYTVADVVGPIGISNSCGGWTIVIAYSNPSLLPRNLNVFDGSVLIKLGNAPVDVNVTGFLTPPSGAVSCELGAVVYDGDRATGDAFSFRETGDLLFYDLANTTVPFNGANDAWNSKITYKNTLVTTRNPAFQNTLGYDASIFNLPNAGNIQLSNGQTSATVRFSSPNENYFVHVLSTSISQYNPTFAVSKTSTDLDGGLLKAGDSLLYRVNFRNVGNDISTQTTVTDNIPFGTTYKPGSLTMGGVPKTDAPGDDEAEYDPISNAVIFRLGTGATAASGGTIAVNSSSNVQFRVLVTTSCRILNCLGDSIRNIARMNYVGLTSNANLFDSSGVDVAGCIIQGGVANFTTGPCYNPSDTILINKCPATSVTIPWRRFVGYRIYSAQPFIPANLYDPSIPVTSSHVYWAYFSNNGGCADSIRIRVFIISCPDIDDDNDGIPDYVEMNNPLALLDANSNGIPNWNDPSYPGFIDINSDGVNDNFDPGADSDNDGIPNFYDVNFPGFVDSNGDAVNDNMDKDRDGIPNNLDLDSDNDGIPDVVESYGVDQDGDGTIDNYSDTDNDGFSQNVDALGGGVAGSGNGLGTPDFDNDGIANYLDADSDNDGIPDVIEVLGADANNDGKIDAFSDSDADGLSDNSDSDLGNDGIAENSSISLLRTGADINNDGRADSYPFKNMDNDTRVNPYDLDSDMDGIVDVIEAGFADADFNGFADGPIGTDGWNIALNAQPSLNIRNSDGRAGPDYLDIDSDDDGIPDNVEGMTTLGYQFPTYLDTDNDGIDNRYDNIVGVGGSGIFVADKDGDTIPDYLDLDTDSDGVPDIVEGNDFNLDGNGGDDVALTFLDTDGDGLDNKFDSLNSVTNIRGTSYMMGTGGSLIGDLTPGTRSPVQKHTVSQPERDWRYVTYVLPLQLLEFSGTQNANIVTLNWALISPLALDKFEIERSIDNIKYEKISTVDADIPINKLRNFAGNDDISKLNNPVIFYRLKVLAVNGQEKYSEVVIIKKGNSKIQLSIRPNPAKDNATVSFYASKDAIATFVIKDYAGKQVLVLSHKVVRGNNSISISGLSKLPDAVYNLQVIIDNEMMTQKLMIFN